LAEVVAPIFGKMGLADLRRVGYLVCGVCSPGKEVHMDFLLNVIAGVLVVLVARWLDKK
jgi:hypothetical protein